MRNNIITTPAINSIDELLAVWRSESSNSDKTKSDFFRFLTTPSLERDIFLQTNCKADVKGIGDIIIEKLTINEP